MIDRLVRVAAVAAAVTAVSVGGALAQSQTPEACLQQAFDLAKAAEAKQPSEEQAKPLEEMLGKIEAHCDAKQFADADKVAAELKAMIDKM